MISHRSIIHIMMDGQELIIYLILESSINSLNFEIHELSKIHKKNIKRKNKIEKKI